jgi:hypothetical protein
MMDNAHENAMLISMLPEMLGIVETLYRGGKPSRSSYDNIMTRIEAYHKQEEQE